MVLLMPESQMLVQAPPKQLQSQKMPTQARANSSKWYRISPEPWTLNPEVPALSTHLAVRAAGSGHGLQGMGDHVVGLGQGPRHSCKARDWIHDSALGVLLEPVRGVGVGDGKALLPQADGERGIWPCPGGKTWSGLNGQPLCLGADCLISLAGWIRCRLIGEPARDDPGSEPHGVMGAGCARRGWGRLSRQNGAASAHEHVQQQAAVPKSLRASSARSLPVSSTLLQQPSMVVPVAHTSLLTCCCTIVFVLHIGTCPA